jgi:hypothetical protein
MLRVIAVLAVIATLAGCGGNQSDDSGVTSVAHRYFAAVASGNDPQACSVLSDPAKLSLRRQVKAAQPYTHRNTKLTCPQELAAVHAFLGRSLGQLRDAALGVPRVSGDAATLPVVIGSRAFDVRLLKTSAGCLIDALAAHVATSTIIGERGTAVEQVCCSVGHLAALSIEPPSAVVRAGGTRLAEFDLGREVAAHSGCLACHRIGEDGNRGPGPDLTQVGSRLAPARIERALVDPTEPMPAFTHLPRQKFRALFVFLSLLRR